MPHGTVTEAIQQLPSIQSLPQEVKQRPYGDSERMNELSGGFAIAIAFGVLVLRAAVPRLRAAAKNSILLVEYALVEVEKGVARSAAVIDACSKRAQPIVMTTVAMGAGMLPIALKIGADADFRAPMAIAVIGGLITSTLLSLFYVPIVFTYVDDLKQWLARSHKLETRTA